jgi:hypothetical protein
MVWRFEGTPFLMKRWGFCFSGGKMKKCLPIVICLFSLLLSSPVLAETKTFLKEYTYQASEFDSKPN